MDIQTDSLGNREGRPAHDSVETLLFLGDSMIFGLGLPDCLTIPALLQIELQATRSVKFVNAGVIGYDFRQYLYQLRRLVPVIQPALVLVGICYNDLFPNEDPFGTILAEREMADKVPKEGDREEAQEATSTVSKLKNLLRGSALYLVFQQTNLKTFLSKPKSRNYTEIPIIKSREQAPELVEEFIATLNELNVPAAFVYFPVPEELGQKSPFIYVTHLEQHNQLVLDLGAVQELTKDSYFLRQKEKYMQPDIHFNLEGSRVVAKEIAGWLNNIDLW
jgi:lysophospholipase L1-like esterase